MKANDIIKKLGELEVTPEVLDNTMESLTYGTDAKVKMAAITEALGEVKKVHSEGGGEGGGEYVCRVYHFTEHDVYLRTTGGYYSHHGTDWNEDWERVYPEKVTVTQYTTKPQPKES